MQLNPYEASTVEFESTPTKRLVGPPNWRWVAVAVFLGAVVNIGGWLLASEGIGAPRRLLFAPVVLLGLQDMSDLMLGAIAGAVLSAGYAGTLTMAKNLWPRFVMAIVVILFHATCIAAVESHAPTYAF